MPDPLALQRQPRGRPQLARYIDGHGALRVQPGVGDREQPVDAVRGLHRQFPEREQRVRAQA